MRRICAWSVFDLGASIAILVSLFLWLHPLRAQTTITIPLASGAGIKIANITRPGVNLGGTTPGNDGPTNIDANLLFAMNGYYAPLVWNANIYCGSSGATTTVWPDKGGSSLPASFFVGSTYAVKSGADAGATGTVTASGSGTLTLSPALTSPCAANDTMIVENDSPSSGWTGTLTPAGMSDSTYGYYHWFYSANGATASFETADISPSSAQTQALEIDAPGSDSGENYYILDTGLQVALNGTYTLTFKAKGLSGTPTITAHINRGTTVYLNQVVTPTVSATNGVGWNNYSYSFTGSETVPTSAIEVSLAGTNGDVRIMDAALTESPISGNTSGLRNAVYQELVRLHPGTIRVGSGNSAVFCSLQDELALDNAVRLCGGSSFTTGIVSSPGFTLPDALAIANAIGAAPWYNMSYFTSPAQAADIVEYLAGTCGNGNQWTTLRCNQGQTTPYTSVFAAKGQKIYLEFANESWNSGNGNSTDWHSNVYGTAVGNVDAAMQGAADWTAEIVRVANGWQSRTQGSGGGGDWLNVVMANSSAITHGQPDAIDGAPYLGTYALQASTNAALFPPMFSEDYSVDSTTIGDETYDALPVTTAYLATNYPATKFFIYEENQDNAQYFLTGTTQAQVNGIVAGTGAGIASVLQQLLALRDSPAPVTNMYAAFQGAFNGHLCTATTGPCSTTISTPVWSSNVFTATTANTIDTPLGYALQAMNSAIGANNDLLNVTFSGQPTYNQAAAQPDPTNGGINSIYANASVPYVDAFGFSDGNGHYSLIAVNDNVAASEAITFAGAGAPTGSVTRSLFTSTNPTDNNQSVAVGGSCTVCAATTSTLTNPTGDTLPADSMVTYTWTVGTPFPAPPAYATEFTGLQNTSGNPGTWTLCYLPGCNAGGNTGGSGTDAFGISSPSLSGSAMSVTSTSGSTGYFNVLAYRHLGCAFLPGATCVQPFMGGILDFWFYVPSTSIHLQALEFPSIQLFDGTHHISTTMQCGIVGGFWQFWDSGTNGWASSAYPCTSPSTNTWHHAQLRITYNGATTPPTYTYTDLSIDGSPIYHGISQTFNAESNTGTATVGIQQQTDNNSTANAANTVYFDNYNAWFWGNVPSAPFALSGQVALSGGFKLQ